MGSSTSQQLTSGRRRLSAAILMIDALIALFPPLYWWAGEGSVAISLTYFIGGGAFLTASIFVLYALDDSGDIRPRQGVR